MTALYCRTESPWKGGATPPALSLGRLAEAGRGSKRPQTAALQGSELECRSLVLDVSVTESHCRTPNLDIFTVDNSGRGQAGRPPSVPATAQWTASAPAQLTSSGLSQPPPPPPPPYSKTAVVYDPNSADELRDWEDRNI